ncbi:hypothetical protein ACVWYG_002196 [Pedobacter sp. UYEF25]
MNGNLFRGKFRKQDLVLEFKVSEVSLSNESIN